MASTDYSTYSQAAAQQGYGAYTAQPTQGYAQTTQAYGQQSYGTYGQPTDIHELFWRENEISTTHGIEKTPSFDTFETWGVYVFHPRTSMAELVPFANGPLHRPQISFSPLPLGETKNSPPQEKPVGTTGEHRYLTGHFVRASLGDASAEGQRLPPPRLTRGTGARTRFHSVQGGRGEGIAGHSRARPTLSPPGDVWGAGIEGVVTLGTRSTGQIYASRTSEPRESVTKAGSASHPPSGAALRFAVLSRIAGGLCIPA
ncbi:hypothetical protein H8959_008466 [Pygathrix nigripes]